MLVCMLMGESISILCPKLKLTHFSSDEQSDSICSLPQKQSPSSFAGRKRKPVSLLKQTPRHSATDNYVSTATATAIDEPTQHKVS